MAWLVYALLEVSHVKLFCRDIWWGELEFGLGGVMVGVGEWGENVQLVCCWSWRWWWLNRGRGSCGEVVSSSEWL